MKIEEVKSTVKTQRISAHTHIKGKNSFMKWKCLWIYIEVLRIRIHMFLGLLDPDPLVRDMDPDPSIIEQK